VEITKKIIHCDDLTSWWHKVLPASVKVLSKWKRFAFPVINGAGSPSKVLVDGQLSE